MNETMALTVHALLKTWPIANAVRTATLDTSVRFVILQIYFSGVNVNLQGH